MLAARPAGAFATKREKVRVGFGRYPAWFFDGRQRAVAIAALQHYFAGYTGSWFERLADHDHPNKITARDPSTAMSATSAIDVGKRVTS